MNNLKDIFQIQKVLRDTGYFDINRISKEVVEYVKNNSFPLERVLKRLQSNEPWEYIQGFTYFKGYNFFVNNSVLIPRVETEMLVDLAKENMVGVSNVVDVGTGSGCIITSLYKDILKDNPTLLDVVKFFGTDISNNALTVARSNSEDTDIKIVNTNLIDSLDLDGNTLILANLPYIPTDIYLELDSSVKDFEPRLALDGGFDGLDIYRELLKQIESKSLNFTLLIEFDPRTKDNLIKIFNNYKWKIYQDQYQVERFLMITK